MRLVAESSFARGLRVLGAIIDRAEARADELARDLEIPISSTYRFLRDLRDREFITESNDGYRLGHRLATTTSAKPTRTDIRQLARPTLEALADYSGETALSAIRAGDHALCLDQVESRHAMRMAFQIGQKLPLHAGAASRVLLAHAPDAVVRAVLEHAEAITEATPLGDDLRARLDAIRETGVATSRGELIPHAIAIAVPVLVKGNCACSLAVAGPDRRVGASWQRELKHLLTQARADIEALL